MKHLQKKTIFLALALVIDTTSAFIAPSTSAPGTAVQATKGDLGGAPLFGHGGALLFVSGAHTYLPYKDYAASASASVRVLDLYDEDAGSPDGYVHYTKDGKPCCFPPIQGQAFGRCSPDFVAHEIETHDESTDITKPMSDQRILSLLVPKQQQQQQEQQQQRDFLTLLLIAVVAACWATVSGASAGTTTTGRITTTGRTFVSLLEENMEEHHKEEHYSLTTLLEENIKEHHSLTTSPRLEELIPEESLKEHHSHLFPLLPILILLLAMLTTSLLRPLTAIEDARSTAFSSHFLFLGDHKELREMTLVKLN
jgi:hypothetical protein